MIDRNKLRNALTYYEMLVLDQRNRISQLRYQIEKERDEDAEDSVRQFGKHNEELYLKLKEMCYEVQGIKSDNMYEAIGTTDSFPSTLEEIEPGIWKFHLPPFFSVSAKKKVYNEGKHMYYLVMNLLAAYERINGRIDVMDRPIVIFRHHIFSESKNIFDYDNIDSKRAIDAMQGYFLKDDNAIYLTTIHEALADPEESYCDIYVLDQKENPGVFGEKYPK